MLATFDLDGFKAYNDTFGHGAGDALLTRLGEGLAEAMGGATTSYRMGGDEFCIMARADSARGLSAGVRRGGGAHRRGRRLEHRLLVRRGWVPSQADDLAEALRVADQRMYANKASRSTSREQTAAALVQVLAEQGDGLDGHADAVAELSILMADQLGLTTEEVRNTGLAAELHDIGKAAIPDTILNKAGKARRGGVGVRPPSHAHRRAHRPRGTGARSGGHDGSVEPRAHGRRWLPGRPRRGRDPDRLTDHRRGRRVRRNGLGPALRRHPLRRGRIAEVKRCAGTQFDPKVVAAFVTALARRPIPSA